jgi:hypothetical protein
MSAVNATAPPRANWLDRLQEAIAHVFDQVADKHHIERFERIMVYLAAIGFLLHLGLIYLAQYSSFFAPVGRLTGTNFLGAIYTPFSFILFYEVLLLVLAIPESTTRALGLQFEIISLIFLRNVFKDLSLFTGLDKIETQLPAFYTVLIDMGGGLLLFLLVGVFYSVASRRSPQENALRAPTHERKQFVVRKKIIALFLSAMFFILAAVSIWTWIQEAYVAITQDAPVGRSLTTIFYPSLYTIIIFTDVLILVLSLLLSDRYQLVFRNAGFVVATILLRISLSASRPYNLIAAVVGTVFGIMVLLIYKYFSRLETTGEVHRFADHDPPSEVPTTNP